MPHAVSVTDGTTTVSLSTTNCMLTHYVPRAPSFDASTGNYADVTDTVEFMVYAAGTALLQTAINSIERVLFAAVERKVSNTGPRCYLTFQAIGEASAWRSEIKSYVLDPADDSNQSFGQFVANYRLVVTRAAWWEGPRTAIALTNGNGTNQTAGLTIRGHDDATSGHDNWVDIASSVIIGSLPAPLEIKLTNNSGGSLPYYGFYIANNNYGSIAHVIEAETALFGYGTAASWSGASGGNHATQVGAGWHNFRWTIPAATLTVTRGRYLRVLGRFTQLLGARKVQVSLWDAAGILPLATAPATFTDSAGYLHVQDCGALPLPAAGYSSGWADHVLQLGVYSDASETIGVDFIQLTPTEPLHFRKFTQIGYSVPNGGAIVDDGIEEIVYYDSGATKSPLMVSRSEPVFVWPNIAQRLFFLYDGAGVTVDSTFSVQAWYRPRRTTW